MIQQDQRRQGIGMTSQRTRERLTQRLRSSGVADESVLQVMQTTPRHLFVEEALASRAYEDTALPIGFGQTISQPLIVARMTEALITPDRPQRILEVGTGSGYQAAILAQLARQVYTLERIARLRERADVLFKELGLTNIYTRHVSGEQGWPQKAPFDGIIVTAAPREVPEMLLAQLTVGGRLVAPIGTAQRQELLVIERGRDGFHERRLGKVSFVPLLVGLE
jgi:protein-L-isoaspartate(D-aspartate) O-methyltransferase